MLNAQTVSVDSARFHREIKDRERLDQRLAGAAPAYCIERIVEGRKTGKTCRRRELPAVRNRGYGRKRSINAGVADWIQKRAVVIHSAAATNHSFAFAEWIPNKAEARREKRSAAVCQTARAISLQSLQIRISEVRVLWQHQTVVRIKVTLRARELSGRICGQIDYTAGDVAAQRSLGRIESRRVEAHDVTQSRLRPGNVLKTKAKRQTQTLIHAPLIVRISLNLIICRRCDRRVRCLGVARISAEQQVCDG